MVGHLGDALGFVAPVDYASGSLELVRQNGLGDILRKHQQMGIARGQRIEARAHQGAISVVNAECGDLQSASGQLFGHTKVLQNLECLRVDHRGAGGVLRRDPPLDKKMIDSGLGQSRRQHKARRASADDQDRGGRGEHGTSCQRLFANMSWHISASRNGINRRWQQAGS